MKILSREHRIKNSIDVLIPCYLYEIVIDETYGGNNILEEAVSKIIQLEPHYGNDTEKLAELLGLKNSSDDMDYRALLCLILNKIQNQQTQEVKREIKQYQIYQERISGEVLGIVTQDVDTFIEGEKVKNLIIFERHGRKSIEPLKCDNKIQPPTQKQIFGAVAQHNKNGDFKIKNNLDLKTQKSREVIYLHCQIVLGQDRSIYVTNGFNSAWSLQLANILSANCYDILKTLRREKHMDEIVKSSYSQVYGDLRDTVAYNLQRFDKTLNGEYLYNGYEKYFEYLANKNDYTIHSYLNTEKTTKELAEQKGFEVRNIGSGFFTNDGQNNLKTLLANLIHNNDSVLQAFAKKYPSFLELLSKLHKDRNIAMHGNDKKKTHKPMDTKELNILKELLEHISGINTEAEKKTTSNNGIILLEQALDEETISAMSNDNIRDLAKVYEALEICRGNQVLDLETFSDITQGLYKVCESMLHKYIQIYKDSISETRKIEWLSKVKEYHIENAKKGEIATLGAYILVYLSINHDTKDSELSYLKKLLELRGHANPTIDDVRATSIQELGDLQKKVINFIKEILKNI